MKTVIIGNNKNVNLAIAGIVKENFQSNCIVTGTDTHPNTFDFKSLSGAGIIIIDFTSIKNNNRVFISEIKELAVKGKIIALNVYNQKPFIEQIINAGASAYLHIDYLHKNLSKAIEALKNGKIFIGLNPDDN
jgi:DNA-binding NarL/FixJ family response regulator